MYMILFNDFSQLHLVLLFENVLLCQRVSESCPGQLNWEKFSHIDFPWFDHSQLYCVCMVWLLCPLPMNMYECVSAVNVCSNGFFLCFNKFDLNLNENNGQKFVIVIGSNICEDSSCGSCFHI